MIRQLHPDDRPLVPADVLDFAHVAAYLVALDHQAPDLDLTWDRALAVGYLAVREFRAGRLDEHRATGRLTFDAEDFDALIASALAFLSPYEAVLDVEEILAQEKALSDSLAALLGPATNDADATPGDVS